MAAKVGLLGINPNLKDAVGVIDWSIEEIRYLRQEILDLKQEVRDLQIEIKIGSNDIW